VRFDAEKDIDASTRHAAIILDGGRYILRDLGSTNGTFVSGERVTGDVVLKDVAQLLKRNLREVDLIARYGGEEFIMLLPQTSIEAAVSKAETIKNFIKKHRFRGIKDKNGLTVSIGISSFPARTIKNKEDIITAADNALYKAKADVRNRTVLYNSPL